MTIRICANCQKELELTPYIQRGDEAGIKFTHGMCIFHFVKYLSKELSLDRDRILSILKKMKTTGESLAPVLKKRPDLVQQYKNGIFKEPIA